MMKGNIKMRKLTDAAMMQTEAA
jgi:muconolactone delta-isomerase